MEEREINVSMPPLEPWQKDLFKLYDKHPKGKIFVTKAVRLVGKSVCLELLLIYASFKESGSESKVISPIFSQVHKIYDDICRIGKDLIKKLNGAELKITFINGSTIAFNSAEQGDNLRGFTIRKSGILAIDEAAFVDSNLFYEVLLPMTNVFNSDIFIFSTPKMKQGFFYDLFMTGLDADNGKVISLDWTTYDTSKYLSAEALEIYRKLLPTNAFKSEYLGQWIDSAGSAFGDITGCLSKQYEDTGVYYFGIDWSGGGQCDYTAISIFNNKRQMADIVYFNDKDETETIRFIVQLVEHWRPKKVLVELNSIGRIFYGLLDKAIKACPVKSIVQGFMTTNESKDQIISLLQVYILNKEVQLLPNDELIKEFNNYEMTMTKNGKRIYNNKPGEGMHDDLVMATAICLKGINTGQYQLSII